VWAPESGCGERVRAIFQRARVFRPVVSPTRSGALLAELRPLGCLEIDEHRH